MGVRKLEIKKHATKMQQKRDEVATNTQQS
jgi:hypothetical protein